MTPKKKRASRVTSVSDLGERGLLRRLLPYVTKVSPATPVGAGDDCAVLFPPASGEQILLTADMMVEGVHFDLRWMSWESLGVKAVASNVSDVASMGGRPIALVFSLGLPAESAVEDLTKFYASARRAARRYGCEIVGGDTARAPKVVVSVAVVGFTPAGTRPALRSELHPGQTLYVSGSPGDSAVGLEILRSAGLKKFARTPDAKILVRRHLKPEVRLELGGWLVRNYTRVAMIDISDGVFNEATLLCEASRHGLRVDLERIPCSPSLMRLCAKLGRDPVQYALYGGEAYELLFAVEEDFQTLKSKLIKAGIKTPIAPIGRVEGNSLRLFRDGKEVKPDDQTFQHFPPAKNRIRKS
ncbi:MAG: thiamine-phosphate kinase [bacterium]